MKRLIQSGPVILTLLLLFLGVNMPRLTSLFLDRRLEGETVQREDNYVSLKLEEDRDFFQTLDLFQSVHSQVVLSEGYRMSAEEVQKAASDIWLKLSLSDMVYMTPDVTPILITSKDSPALSGVYWLCVSEGEKGFQSILWLDDQSGEMVAFQSRVKQSDSSSNMFDEAAMKTAEYCRLYYPVDTVKLALDTVETDNESYIKIRENDSIGIATAMAEYDTNYTVKLIRSQDGLDDIYTVSLRFKQDWIIFHM